MEMDSYYYNKQIQNSERVILAENLKFPMQVFQDFLDIKDTPAPFFYTIQAPLLDQSGPYAIRSSVSPVGNLHTRPFIESNYVQLILPGYIIRSFVDKIEPGYIMIIPKGKEFLITTVNGSIDISDHRIIGLWDSNK